MARMNGCNDNIKPAGTNSTRMNPKSFARNNMSKGGVNDKKDLAKSDMKSLPSKQAMKVGK